MLSKTAMGSPRPQSLVWREIVSAYRIGFLLLVSLLLFASAACERIQGAGGDRTPPRGSRLDHSMGSVLPTNTGPDLMDECTTANPSAVRAFWLPAPADIAALEERLGPVLQGALKRTAGRGTPPRNADEYYRQYVGIVRADGRRMIYVNGFHRQFARWSSHLKQPWTPGDTLKWRVEPISICDGGSISFGVEYDPRRAKFSRVRFNGRASR